MGLLQSQPALLKQEVSLRLGLIVTMMEQLTSDDALTFSDMEAILSEVQTTLNEALQTCNEGKADWKNFPLTDLGNSVKVLKNRLNTS